MLQHASTALPSAPSFGTPVVVNGARLEALVEGALWWPDQGMLIVSDMHLEKGSAFAARGVFLPPYDSAATLARLEAVIARINPTIVVALGDSFHDLGAGGRMAGPDVLRLQALATRIQWIWVEGNHDPAPPGFFAGERTEVVRSGPLTLRHEPQIEPEPGEIAGHLHPCAIVKSDVGRRVRAKCFATDGTRLVMPSFGAFTGNLNVCDRAFGPLFPRGCGALVRGKARVYSIPAKRLVGERD
jgi:uncharacterized protein